MTARITFEHELQVLHNDLKKMGIMIEGAIDCCMEAFENQDEVLAREVIAGDRMINDMEKTIETECLSLILKQQPVARDLRAVSTALKVVTDMERIGDHAADIADLIQRMKGKPPVYRLVQHIPEMARVAKQMVKEALEAFVTGDIDAAKDIIPRDDVVDELFNNVKLEVVHLLQDSSEHADECVDVLMIAKYMERIGDHAVNICEWTEFGKTAVLQDVRIL